MKTERNHPRVLVPRSLVMAVTLGVLSATACVDFSPEVGPLSTSTAPACAVTDAAAYGGSANADAAAYGGSAKADAAAYGGSAKADAAACVTIPPPGY